MAPLPWYFFGDIDCYMRGGRRGSDYALAHALSQPGVDAQAIVDNLGSPTAPPGIADVVSGLVQASPNRHHAVPVWTPQDWPLDWKVAYYGPGQSDVDGLVLAPGVTAFQWPPAGGGSLSVNVSGLSPNFGNPNVVRYGDAIIQAADKMITTPEGRQRVEVAAANAGSVDQVNAIAIMKRIDPDLRSTKEPPPSFSVALNSTLLTTDTRLRVNANGGVHLEVGWIEVVDDPEDEDSPIQMRDYPCGGFL